MWLWCTKWHFLIHSSFIPNKCQPKSIFYYFYFKSSTAGYLSPASTKIQPASLYKEYWVFIFKQLCSCVPLARYKCLRFRVTLLLKNMNTDSLTSNDTHKCDTTEQTFITKNKAITPHHHHQHQQTQDGEREIAFY